MWNCVNKENEKFFISLIKEGYFRIDNQGKVYRIAKLFNNGKTKKQIPLLKEIECKRLERGYIRISVWRNNKRIKIYAHRMVWIYFNGKIPDGMQVNHKKGIRDKNNPEDLELLNNSENNKHAYRVLGRKSSNSKLSRKEISEIIIKIEKGESMNGLAKKYGVSYGTINYIRGKTLTNKGENKNV